LGKRKRINKERRHLAALIIQVTGGSHSESRLVKLPSSMLLLSKKRIEIRENVLVIDYDKQFKDENPNIWARG
jgi:hypothetical protein